MTDEVKRIEDAIQGDRSAIKSIIDEHSTFVVGICMQILKNKAEAEEAAQDAFLKMYKSLSTFNYSSKFTTWLYRIAYRTAIDLYRKRKPTESIDDHPIQFQIEDSTNHGSVFENKDLRSQIEHAMAYLKVEDAALIRMYYFKEMNIKELSKICNAGESNIKIRLFRIRKKMKSILQTQLNKEIKSFIHES